MLAQASPRDVLDLQYQRYVYLGDDSTLDLSSAATFMIASLWRQVLPNDVAPDGLSTLASTDGVADVRKGQWVEDRRDLLSVTLQITDDLNISAAGVVAVKSEGEVILRAKGDLQIDNRSGLSIKGIAAVGRVHLEDLRGGQLDHRADPGCG